MNEVERKPYCPGCQYAKLERQSDGFACWVCGLTGENLVFPGNGCEKRADALNNNRVISSKSNKGKNSYE